MRGSECLLLLGLNKDKDVGAGCGSGESVSLNQNRALGSRHSTDVRGAHSEVVREVATPS